MPSPLQPALPKYDMATPGSKVSSSPLMPWPADSQIVPGRGFGLDLDGGIDRNAAENWRYQTAYLRLAYDAVAQTFTLNANTVLPMWQAGQEQGVTIAPTAATPTWTQTRSETDLYKGGAPVPRDYVFRIRAIGFALGRPFMMEDPADPSQVHSQSMDPYVDRILSALWDVLGVQATFSEQACSYELGLAQFHAMPSGKVQTADHARAGVGIGVMNMLPLRGSIWAGARDESDQLTINVTSPSIPVKFLNDALNPLPDDIYVPVTLQAYGSAYFTCPPQACAPGIDRAELVSAIREVMGK